MVIKLRSLALALVFFCLTVNNGWAQYAGTGTFTKATSLAALTDGYYIVGYESSATAGRLMTNTNAGTFFADAVTAPSSGVLTNPAAANVWLIRTDGGGRTIYNEASGTYVSYTGSSNAAQAVTSVTANNQRWTFAYGTLFTATNLAVTSRLLKSNSAATRFACYTTGQNDLTLYKLPTVTTIAQLTNGIASSPLTAGVTNKAILGFSASATGVPNLTAFNIGTTSTSVNKFTNLKLYVSTDNDYSTTGDNTLVTATFNQTATQIQVSAITEALGFTAKNYFIVADVDASVTGSTTAVQPSLINTNVTTSIGTVAAATLTGTNYSFAAGSAPGITSSLTASGTYGSSFSYTIVASNSPTGYSTTALPAGLSLTGAVISGTPTTSGTFNVDITATNGSGSDTKTLVITIAKIALTASGATATSKTYDGSTNAAITGGTLTGVLPGDAGNVTVSATGTFSDKNVGTGKTVTLALAGSAAGNYTLSTTVTADINAKALTIGAPSISSKTYNATTAAGAVTPGALSGFVGSETVTATGAAAAYSSANVGSYPGVVITYTLNNGTNGGLATNYSLANGSATGAITAKALSITAATIASKVYDATTTAGAVTPGTLSGFVGSETVTATGVAAAYSSANAATYSGVSITYTLANGTNGGLATNYSLANTTASGTVTAKALSITAPTIADKTYNGLVATGAVTPGTLSGFVGTQTVTVSAATGVYATATSGTGKTATITYTLANGTNGGLAANYSLTGTGTGNINKAALTATADDKTKVQGAVNPTLTISYSGFVNSETVAAITPPTASTTAVTASPLGTYPITLSGGSATNYTITLVNGTLTVITGPCFSEDFANASTGDNTTTGGSGTAWSLPSGNIASGTNVFQAGGAVKLGSGSATGSMTSTAMTGVSGNITVSFDVKGWTTVEGDIDVTIGSTTQTVTYANKLADGFVNKQVTFTGVVSGSTLTIATTAKRAFIDNMNVTCAPAAPNVNVTGNTVTIPDGTSGTTTTNFTQFAAAEVGSNSTRTFYVENNGTAGTITLGNPKVTITGAGAAAFSVAQPSAATLASGASSSFVITFSPTNLVSQTATVHVWSDDPDLTEQDYTFNVTGTGSYSQQSTITVASGFTAPANIAYINTTASNITPTPVNSVEVGRFTITDGPDNDNVATILTNISFSLSNHANIQRVALYDGSTELDEVAGAATVSFSGLSLSTGIDGGTKNFSLRVTYNTTVTDNQQYQFTVTSVTASASGSGFASYGASTSVTGNDNKIVVTASALKFGTMTDGSVSPSFLPSFTVSAVDANQNVDADAVNTFTLTTSSASGMTSAASYTLVAGTKTITDVQYSATKTNETLTAKNTSTGTGIALNSTYPSGTFDVTAFAAVNGSFLSITGTGSYTAASSWCKCGNVGGCSGTTANAGGWGATGAGGTPTSAATVYVQGTITQGSSVGATNATILSGGSLILNANYPVSNSITVKTGGTLQVNAGCILTPAVAATFTVEDNADVYINKSFTSPSAQIWNGIEDFYPESNLYINNWDVREYFVDDNVTLNQHNGYTAAFGNVYIDAAFTGIDYNNGIARQNWDMLSVNNGSSFNLTHGNFEFVRTPINNFSVAGGAGTDGPKNIRFMGSVTGTFAVNIHGDLKLNSTWVGTAIGATKGNFTLSVDGNVDINSPGALWVRGSTAAGNTTLSIAGNLLMNGAGTTSATRLYMNQNSYGTTPNGNKAIVNLAGNLSVGANPAIITSCPTADAEFNFTGTSPNIQLADVASVLATSGNGIPFNIKSGATVQLSNNNFTYNNGSTLTVEAGGVLDFNWGSGNVPLLVTQPASPTGTNVFKVNSGGTIKITSEDASGGITASGAAGNVRTSTRTYDAAGIYHYTGKANQKTGNGLPDLATTNLLNGKVIVELNTDALTLTPTQSRTIGVNNTLEIRKGILVAAATTTDFSGAGNVTMSGGTYQIGIPAASAVVPQLTGTYSLTGGTVELNGTATQKLSVLPSSYYKLHINATGPVTLNNGNIAVSNDLKFTSGIITTSTKKVTLAAAGTVTGAASNTGWVNGNFEKFIAASTATKNFEIGDALYYAPVNLNFTGSTNGVGSLTAFVSARGTNHPQIATSGINNTAKVNRYWNITNSGVTFTTYSATFNFINPGDLDAGAIGFETASSWKVAKYTGSTWSLPTMGTRTTASTQVTGLTAFSDFIIGKEVVTGFVWTGASGTDFFWNTANNWSPAGPPTSTTDATIPVVATGYPVVNATPAGICKALTVDNGASVTINSGQFLNVNGNVVNNGNAAFGAGTLSLEGNGSATVAGTITVSNVDIDKSVTVNSGAALNIITSLDLQSGMLTNNGTITLKSTSTGTAYLDNFSSTYSGDYSGNLTVERYVASAGTHYIGYPFTSYALTSPIGFSGPVIPQPSCNANATATNSPFSNIYKWKENTTFTSGCSQQGWVAVTNENSVTGQGYAVTLGSNQTLSLTGAPIIDDYNYGATKSTYTVPNPTPSAGVFNPLYTQVTGGTNLVSNPFPSPYEWDGGDGLGGIINDVAYVWQTSGTYKGTYQTIAVGDVLAVGQGFFVKATADTDLSFVNSKRKTATNPTFYQTNNGANLDITMAGNGFADRTQIVFNDQATLGFDGTFDGFKMLGNYNQPTLYTVMMGNMMATINTLPSIDQSPNVVMGMFVGTSGNYELTFNNINSFDPTSYIYLEDTKTGTMQDMRANNTYSFAATTSDDADRFVIHFTPAAEINTADADCNNSGTINITQPGTATWTYTVTDNNNATISSGSLNQNSAATVNAVAGTYTLTLTDANNYIVMKTVTVNGSTPIAASFTPSATTVEETNDVTFNSTTANASTTSWDFGDGATASTATATHAYATPGTYTVTLTVTNATGCSSTTTQVITVTAKTTTGLNNVTANKALNIWSNDNRVFIDFSKQLNVEATIEFYNVLGQQLMQEKFGRSTIFIKELSNIEAAYVIVKVKNNDTITTKKVFIMNK
jgi:fibronectin-binding autotransporter adhesin